MAAPRAGLTRPALGWHRAGAALGLLTVLLVAGRLAIYLLLQFPAPVGDGVLFASVAQYHCGSGRFETPIFPLDPTGAYRYMWHAIAHPALLSWLNPDCSVFGGFLALSLVLLVTVGIVCAALVPTRGWWVALMLAGVVFALQAKQGFRPESTTLLVVVLCEALRQRRHTLAWTTVFSALPWLHPTSFLLYGAWVLLTTDRQALQDLRARWLLLLPLALSVNLALWALYPFPVMDLMQGLAEQGRTFAQRNDGGLFNYWVRSDFFPLLGLAFVLVYGLCVIANRRLLLLLPLLWFYGFRVPPTYYNLVPLFGAMLLSLWMPHTALEGTRREHAKRWVLLLCTVLALGGLAQSALRDLGSWVQYRSTLDAALAQRPRALAGGAVPCEVPGWFALTEPAAFFLPSHVPTARACDAATAQAQHDVVSSGALGRRANATGCAAWPHDTPVPGLRWLFRSDSGYGFAVCPRPGPEASRP